MLERFRFFTNDHHKAKAEDPKNRLHQQLRIKVEAVEKAEEERQASPPGSEAAEPEVQHTGEEQGVQQEEPKATRGEDVLPRVKVQEEEKRES